MRFTRTAACAAIIVFSLSGAALAQSEDQGPPSQLQQARDAAKTAALNDLNSDHRAQVQTILQQVQSGSVSMDDAVKQVDGILSDTEKKAVLDEQHKLRDATRQAFASSGSGTGSFGGFGGHVGFGGRQGTSTPDAGQFLLMLLQEYGRR